MDIYDFASKVYEEAKLEEALSMLDYINARCDAMYPKTKELRHGLDCFLWKYEGEADAVRASTTWKVGSTLYEFLEEPFTGRTAFVAWDISPDWAITLSME